MKRALPIRVGITAVLLFLLFNSCNKAIFSQDHFPDPLVGGCQVAEFHNPQFDSFFPQGVDYLFKKKYDPSGKTLKEIIFSISEDLVPSTILQRQADYQVVDKGRKVYLITLDTLGHGMPDTSAIIYLNALGRPDSCVSYSRLSPHFDLGSGQIAKTYFFYQDQRIHIIRTDSYFDAHTPFFSTLDTARYDKFGNVLSMGFNTYKYDYARPAKQQCYLDDYEQNLGELYMLEYLGYFPELTSPVNVRISAINNDVSEGGPLQAHKFDADDKLIGYNGNTITWNCPN